MDDIWQKFHRLPKVIRNAVATPEALATIDRLEQANPGLDLANFVMRVMVKDVDVPDLAKTLISDAKIDSSAARQVVDDLTQNVFSAVNEYLGIPKPAPAPIVVPEPPSPMIPAETPQPVDVQSAIPPISPTVPTTPSVPTIPTPMPIAPPLTAPEAPIGNVAPPPSLSAEDDAELAASAAKLHDLHATQAVAAMPTDFDAAAQAILDQHELAFQDDLLTKRSLAILKARLKGMRSADDTQAMLTRPPKVGGLGLDPDVAMAIMATVEKTAHAAVAKGMVHEVEIPTPLPLPKVPAPEQQKPNAVPPLSRDFSTMKPDPIAVNVQDARMPGRPIYRPEDIPAPPTIPSAPVPVKPAVPPAKPVVIKTTPAASPAAQRPRNVDRPSVSDITAPSSTLGPAEEMSSFTLVQFRRLGQGAADSANKILSKLQHLQNESFALWAQAVAGWRESEVYRIYLDMGRQSLDQNLSIDQVIQKRAAAALPYLSEHEFNVLADMNRRIQI